MATDFDGCKRKNRSGKKMSRVRNKKGKEKDAGEKGSVRGRGRRSLELMGVGTKELTPKSPSEAMERKGDEAHRGGGGRASCWAAGGGQTPGNPQVFICYANDLRH